MLNFAKKFLNLLGFYPNSIIFFFNGLKSRTCMSFCFSKTTTPSKFFSLVSSGFHWSINTIYGSLLVNTEFIKIQELSFLSEYFLVTALFCLTLFFLFSVKSIPGTSSLEIRYIYNNQFIFLVIYILCCYLILVSQQMDISSLSLTSFNDTIYNDQLSFVSKFVIGITSILYLMFIHKYLKNQKLNNFEYYIILLISIFGFFLLCSVNDFITSYLAIELQGLAFYVLASFKKSSNFSVESGVKYFVLGSLSTALFLLGITLIYGLCGSILFSDFKDFFIWILSTNGAFFFQEFFSGNSESFQESYNIGDVSLLEKLDSIDFKLDLMEQNLDCAESALTSLQSGYGQFLSELDCSLKIRFLRFFENDFLFENYYQSHAMNFLYFIKEYTLDYAHIIKLKFYFSESNFYETTNLYISDGLLAENSLKHIFMGNCDLSCADDFSGKSSFDNVLFSGNLSHVLGNSCEFLNKSVSNFYSQAYEGSQDHVFSLAQTMRINYLFLEFGGDSPGILLSKFNSNLIVVGVLIVIIALFFKLALAPFHLWSPDVYEGSPSSSTFFFMVLSKFGIFVLLLRICYSSFYSLISYWQFFSLFIASISIFVGAVAGLKQRKLKSLLTYSSINNMGFVLLAFSAGSFEGIQVNFYYLVVYMLSSVCIWSIVLNLNLKTTPTTEKQNRDLGDLTLLQESNSILAQNLGITLFSLAGLPPMVGFLAKMGVFKALGGVSIYYVSVLNILFSVIATFYYLRVIKIIFFENVLIGHLYESIDSKKIIITNFLAFSLVFFFFNPMLLYLSSYKMTLFLNKSFF